MFFKILFKRLILNVEHIYFTLSKRLKRIESGDFFCLSIICILIYCLRYLCGPAFVFILINDAV